MTALEKKLIDKIKASEDLDFPSLQVQAYSQGRKCVDLRVGEARRFFDLASLTKILFTGLWFVDAITEKRINFDSTVSSLLPWYPHARIRVGHLLSHSAGNAWWQPFYKEINTSLNPEQAWQQMEKFCQKAPLAKNIKAVYSDLDYYLLGSVMQKVERKPLIHIWSDWSPRHYPQRNLHFNYKNQSHFEKHHYAPTEKCQWRNKVMQGEVHDENCWALGGVASHAGLFGDVEDLSFFGKKVRDLYRGSSLRSKVLKKMVTRSMPIYKGDWGYGFMLPSQKNSSAGDLFGKNSFGHTGFTGISFWMDPKKDLFVSLVSNRVHPSRENKGFIRLRPKIHDWIVEGLF